jgi:hypothetical protein
MLVSFRTWLADILRPVPHLPPSPAPEPARAVARKDDDDDREAERRDARLERRRRDAEALAKTAQERADRAEAARKAAEERARTLDLELAQARERARSAETRVKKAADDRVRKGGKRSSNGGGGTDPAVEKVRAAEDRLRSAQARVQEIERGLADAEARLKSEQSRSRELAQQLAEAEARREVPAAAPRAITTRRELPRTSLDVHFSPGDECLFAICRQIEAAEKSADVCVFTITDDRIASRLLDAHRRGVRVRIITDNDKAYDDGSDVHRLGRAGIEVRVDRTPFHMHHKFALFDDRRMLTGSYNWTRGAARDNQENVVVSDDPRLLKPFGREFAGLWDKLDRV